MTPEQIDQIIELYLERAKVIDKKVFGVSGSTNVIEIAKMIQYADSN